MEMFTESGTCVTRRLWLTAGSSERFIHDRATIHVSKCDEDGEMSYEQFIIVCDSGPNRGSLTQCHNHHNNVVADYAGAVQFAVNSARKVVLADRCFNMVESSRGKYVLSPSGRLYRSGNLPAYVYALCLAGRPVYYGVTDNLNRELPRHFNFLNKALSSSPLARPSWYDSIAAEIQAGVEFEAVVVYSHFEHKRCRWLARVLAKAHYAYHGAGSVHNSFNSGGVLSKDDVDLIQNMEFDYAPLFVAQDLNSLVGHKVGVPVLVGMPEPPPEISSNDTSIELDINLDYLNELATEFTRSNSTCSFYNMQLQRFETDYEPRSEEDVQGAIDFYAEMAGKPKVFS